jgi:hypothetical protein
VPFKKKTKTRSPLDVPGLEYTAAGKPRWVAQPRLRAAGWQSHMLRDDAGLALDETAACARAREINAAVALWRGDQPIPASFAAIAPAGAALEGKLASPVPAVTKSHRTIGYLMDAYLADDKPAGTPITKRTQRNYRHNLKRFMCAVAKADGLKFEQLRAYDIIALKVPKRGSGLPYLVQLAYDELYKTDGVHVAAAAITVARCFFNWVIGPKQNLLTENPCHGIKVEQPEGRIVVFEDCEIDALVEAADWIGLHGIADAVILSLDTTLARQDVIALSFQEIDAANVVRTNRLKTNRLVIAELVMPLSLERLERLRRRRNNTGPSDLVILTPSGKPYSEELFRLHFNLVKEIASAALGLPRRIDEDDVEECGYPGILAKEFRDLRDTGITNCILARMPDRILFLRSGHSPRSGPKMLAGHYAKVGKKAADVGASILKEFWAAKAAAAPPVA